MTNQSPTFPEAIAELLRLAEMASLAPWTADLSKHSGHCGIMIGGQSDNVANVYLNMLDTSWKENPINRPENAEAFANANLIAFARNFAEQWKEELIAIGEGGPRLADVITVSDIGLARKLFASMGYINTNPEQDAERIAAMENIWAAANRFKDFVTAIAHPPTTKPDDGCLRYLRAIVNHWNEFGYEDGMDEIIHDADKYLSSNKALKGTGDE